MEFNIKIDQDKKVQTSIHTIGESLPEIELGMKLAIKELQNQLDKPDFDSPPHLDFLYANTPDGSLVALYNGKVEIELDQNVDTFGLSHFGSISNPPRPPSIVESRVTTRFYYTLTFENPLPDEWSGRDFCLRIGNIDFFVVSSITDKNGKSITTCVNKDFEYTFYQKNTNDIEQS